MSNTGAGPSITVHPDHEVIEATLTQPASRCKMWCAVITHVSPGSGDRDLEWIAYLGADEEKDSGTVAVGDGTVIEVSVDAAADTPADTWYYRVDMDEGELEEIGEDEVRDAVRDRVLGAKDEDPAVTPTVN